MSKTTIGTAAALPATAANDVSVADGMTRAAEAVEATLEHLLPKPSGFHARVLEAMRYATFAGGKRLRPYLTLAGARLFDVPEARALRAASAIEVLHTYSLVHDDLPCMDDDDLRRGRPTTHRQFDEATAVLAGDGLLTIAFEILAEPETHPSGEVRSRLVSRLAKAAGGEGMIGGPDDGYAERQPEVRRRPDHPVAADEDRRPFRICGRSRTDLG